MKQAIVYSRRIQDEKYDRNVIEYDTFLPKNISIRSRSDFGLVEYGFSH